MTRRILLAAALVATLAAGASALLGASLAGAQGEPQIPPWVRTLAAAWSGGEVSDAEFVAAMGFLISHGIIPSPTQQTQDNGSPEPPVHDHEHALDTIQDNVTYGAGYEHYAHHVNSIADIAVPDDDGKCFDRFGNVRQPSINLKFKINEYIKTFVDVTGGGIDVDSENEDRPIWYQLFNETHSVSPVYYIRAFDTGLQVGDTIWMFHMQKGESYEIRSVYGEQCGRSKMVLAY